jgi:hypothetical protein
MEFIAQRKGARKNLPGSVHADVFARNELERFLRAEYQEKQAAAQKEACADMTKAGESELEDDDVSGDSKEEKTGDRKDPEKDVKQVEVGDPTMAMMHGASPSTSSSTSALASTAAQWSRVVAERNEETAKATAVRIAARRLRKQKESQLRAAAALEVKKIRQSLARTVKFTTSTNAAQPTCRESCSVKNGHEEYCYHGPCGALCDPDHKGHHQNCPYYAAYAALEEFLDDS